VLSANPAAHGAPVGQGVSRALATARSARLSGLHYTLELQLTPHAQTLAGQESLFFTDSGSGDLPLDYRDGALSAASLNGTPIPTALRDGHLNLPSTALRKGPNELQLSFRSQIGTAGKAITRYEDRDDGNEYLYSLFVPMDASMAFPCFDQPDLKGRFSLTVTAPSAWTVIANTRPTITAHAATSVSVFPQTPPISTYLFAFAAGPFESLPGTAPGEPSIYVRKSQLARARVEAPQVRQITARGIAYFSAYFAQPFPFSKYDLVLIPGFPFGGMEHAGATFLNEDGVLFRTAPTQSDYFRRDTLVLHETCHQWFGDLVTMRWFDDLWLKEGFAQYMAYKALAELQPAQIPWKRFYEDIKPLAYGIDETQGTTPIFQNIANLKDAKSAYGAIVYEKAPAVLKQLNFKLGDTNFRDGLRLYLKQHAYSNAEFKDLIDAFERTASTHQPDLQPWAAAWIAQRGMPQVSVSWSCTQGRIDTLSLTQKDELSSGHLWPLSTELLLSYPTGAAPAIETLRIDWNHPQPDHAVFPVHEAVGKPCPRFVLANAGDFAYGRFLLDPVSEKAVSEELLQPGSDKLDPLLRSMLWGALWDNVHVAGSSPASYVTLALKSLPAEPDEALSRIQGARVATALHAYMSESLRSAFAPRVEAVFADRMLHAPALGTRIVSFRTFTAVAETPDSLARLKDLLNGKLAVPGMPLKPLDRWNLIGHLIALNDPEASALFTAEKARDRTGEGQKYAYAVEAGTPSADTKARYFDEYLHSPDRQEDWITQSLRPFNSWNQAALTAPFLTRALDSLPEIKQHRKIFFLGAWLGAFLDGQHSPEAQTAVHTWLAHAQLDPDLRLKVLEVSDALDRTVAIRRKFPE
jgi:aminopeptidase N